MALGSPTDCNSPSGLLKEGMGRVDLQSLWAYAFLVVKEYLASNASLRGMGCWPQQGLSGQLRLSCVQALGEIMEYA